jgi:hypothetical protein
VTGAAVAANAAPRFKKLSSSWAARTRSRLRRRPIWIRPSRRRCAAAFWNQGEIWPLRLAHFVEQAIYDAFVEGFVAAREELKIEEDFGA